ncbi:MAG: hypothetical protein P1U56_08910 [Saprospiraceae bacterium]|nr:hypothetical protein [Saprospiraceae bacterium]
MAQAPRAFNRGLHSNRNQVFYGTDDGSQDGSFGEFPDFIKHYESVDQSRKDDIHMISVVGGLYGLNMIPLWKPKKLTIFDINPMGVVYFTLIHRVWTTSNSAQHFLDRLENMDYDANTEDEKFVQENISLKAKGTLPRSRGSSKRSFYDSWKYALDNFEITKQILLGPLEIRTEPMESESFSAMIRNQNNSWIYASNITQFHFFDLEFEDPSNCVMLQIIHPEQPQLLDISEYAGQKVKVKFEIPMRVEII